MAEDEFVVVDDDDDTNYKSICCENIPEIFLDKLVAKKHFSKFGKIKRFILRPNRLSCTIEYETEQQAERAVEQAGNYNGHEFNVSYAKHEVAHVQNTEEWVDPDVQAELDSMGGHRQTLPPKFPTTTRTGSPKLTTTRTSSPKLGTSTPQVTLKPKSQELARIDANTRNEIESILRRPALTDEDKYRALDARDRLIRLTTVRQTDIKKATSTRGFCPDMCPEKERLMREFQRQVSIFEADDNNANCISHYKAIKEYSRSSADQEVPLAHELRPEGVLKMTMLYLMHRIMDLCNDPLTSLGDWFHFIWDRTRSIRKDITQQELCSLEAVQLVEQCARFHIHCAARMVAEDPAVFDRKINAENLTKCLQTLKYMYHDLRIKHTACPCEAEFRSYIILLNLGDSSFQWELQQLPEHIQKSAKVKQAIAFYNALQSNNYVRFFNMIRSPETSYLSACILVGYFYRLRLRSLDAIIKSHSWRKSVTFLPLSYLCRVLGFEDNETAADFFNTHGLECENERVMLSVLEKPDVEYSSSREIKLVESKLQTSVGEVVCGHPLESADIFEYHEPHNSFDANGYLKLTAWTAQDQQRGEAALAMAAEKKQSKSAVDSSSLFKMPQSAAPKQQQHQKPTVAGNLFGNSVALPKLSTDEPPKATEPMFKMPIPTKNAFPANVTSSVFKPITAAPAPTTGGSIFATAPGSSNTALVGSGSNIFSKAAKETSSIFQTAADTGNIFQQPRPSAAPSAGSFFKLPEQPDASSLFKLPTPTADSKPPEGIFAAAANTSPYNTRQAVRRQQDQEAVAKRRATAEQRMRELEDEDKRNQQLLEEERAKLRAMEELQARKRNLALLEADAKKKFAEFFDSVITDEVGQIAEEELTKHKALTKRAEQLTEALLAEVLEDQVAEIAHVEYECSNHDRLLMSRYFQRWLEQTRKKILHRSLLQSLPVWVTTDTSAQQAQQLEHPRMHENLQMIKRYRHGAPCDFSLLLRCGPDLPPPPPVDVFAIIKKQFVSSQPLQHGLLQMRKYYKLVFSLPAEMDELPGFESLCNRWLQKYIKPAQQPLEDSPAYLCAMEQQVALCIRKLSGTPPTNERGELATHELDNADALVFFMSGYNLRASKQRLFKLRSMSAHLKCPPIAFVVYDSLLSDWMLHDSLDVVQLLDEGVFSASAYFGCSQAKRDFRFDAVLKKALKFVANKSSSCETEALEMQSLQTWLEANLGEEMWQRWKESALSNPAFSKLCSLPQHIIALHNEAVQRLHDIANEDFTQAADFAEELRPFVPNQRHVDIPLGLEYFPPNWKQPNRQKRICQFLNELKLPALPSALPQDVEGIEYALLDYATRCMPESDGSAVSASYLAIHALVAQLKRADLADLDIQTRFALLDFLPIMKPIAHAHINEVLVLWSQLSLPSEIIYKRQRVVDNQELPWWLDCQAIQGISVDYKLADSQLQPANTPEKILTDQLELSASVQSAVKKAKWVSSVVEANAPDVTSRQSTWADNAHIRMLDEGLQQFELDKERGVYDISLGDELSDYDEREYEHDGLCLAGRKRKHKEVEDESDDAISKAMKLIQRVDQRYDKENSFKRQQIFNV